MARCYGYVPSLALGLKRQVPTLPLGGSDHVPTVASEFKVGTCGVGSLCCCGHVPPQGGGGGRGGDGGNNMLLMLGVVSSMMMLHDADMLLVPKIRVVLARHRRFLPVCFGQS